MGFTYVHRNGSHGGQLGTSVTSFTLSPTTAAAAGNGVILHISIADAANVPTAVTDDAGNTWGLDVEEVITAPGQAIARSSLAHPLTTSTVITVTVPITNNKTGPQFTWTLDEFAETTGATQREDGTGSRQTGTSNTPSSGTTSVPAVADLCVVGFAWLSNTINSSSFTAGYTALAVVSATGALRAQLAYNLSVSTAQTVTCSLSASIGWSGVAQLYSGFFLALSATASDSVAVSDSVTRGLSTARTAADTVAVSDSAAIRTAFARTASDIVSVSDSVARSLSTPRTAADTVAVSDAAAKTDSHARTASDAVAVADSATRGLSTPRSAADAVAVSDSVAKLDIQARSAADAVAVGDTAAGSTQTGRSAADTVAVSDSASQGSSTSRTASDAVSVGDGVTRILAGSRTASDLVVISDAVSRGGSSLQRGASDSVSVSDQAGVLTSGGRGASDHTPVTDAATSTTSMGRLAGDIVSVFDAVTVTSVAIVLNPGRLNGSQTSGGVLVPSEIDGDALRGVLSASGILAPSATSIPSEAAVSAGQSMLSGVLSGRIKGGVR